MFGEYVLARKFVNMVKEVLMKMYLNNIFYGIDLKLVPEKYLAIEVYIKKPCNTAPKSKFI